MSKNNIRIMKLFNYNKLCEIIKDIFKITIKNKVILNNDYKNLEKLFKKIPLTKKKIKKFFNIMKQELSEEFMFHNYKVWERFFIYLRNYYRYLYNKHKTPDICKISKYFFKKLKEIENECYDNCDFESNYSKKDLCLDARLSKSTLCKHCGKKRYMYLFHVNDSKTKCIKCGKCVILYYEECCNT